MKTDELIAWLARQRLIDRVARKLVGHYTTIFMLHRAQPRENHYRGCDLGMLEQCLRYATEHDFHFATVDEVVQMALQGITPSAPTLCFTIDDGFRDQVTELVPVLLHYNAKPTIFVLTDFVDGRDWPWDAKLSYLAQNSPRKQASFSFNGKTFELDLSSLEKRTEGRRALVRFTKYLPGDKIDPFLALVSEQLEVPLSHQAGVGYEAASWDELRAMHAKGLNVAAHGCSHKVFSGLSSEQVREELRISRERVQTEIPAASQVFAYPSGTHLDFNRAHNAPVADAGFMAAVSAIPGNCRLSDIKADLFNIRRHSFPETTSQFIRYSSWFEFLRSRWE